MNLHCSAVGTIIILLLVLDIVSTDVQDIYITYHILLIDLLGLIHLSTSCLIVENIPGIMDPFE